MNTPLHYPEIGVGRGVVDLAWMRRKPIGRENHTYAKHQSTFNATDGPLSGLAHFSNGHSKSKKTLMEGPALWYTRWHCYLRHQNLLWALVHVLTAPLPIQLPANMLGKAAEDGLSVWAPVTQGEMQTPLLPLAWPSVRCCSHVENEPVGGGSLPIIPSPSVTLKINALFKKKMGKLLVKIMVCLWIYFYY